MKSTSLKNLNSSTIVKIVLLAISLIPAITYSQITLVLQPSPSEGKDAGLSENFPTTNFGASDEFITYYWTFSGNQAAGYSLLEFDLSAIPPNAQINSAYLSLYYNPTSSSAGQAGNNASYLKMVTSPWDENTVTWSTLPTTTAVNQVYLPTSTAPNQDYTNIDITDFVVDWHNNPTTNYGMQLELIDQSLYNSMKFCSSDYSDPSLRPKLIVTYTESSESNNDTCVTWQPGPVDGVDAVLPGNSPSTNAGDNEEIISYYWTFSGNEASGFSLVKFDLSFLPANIQVNSANLSLYYNPTSSSAGQAGNNACYLKMVTSPWDEYTVTWNTIPTTTSSNQVYIPTSTSSGQDYPNIDITNFVVDWYNDPSTNYGMKLELIDQSLYNSMKFCSSDYSNPSLRPKLEICYTYNCTTKYDTITVTNCDGYTVPSGDETYNESGVYQDTISNVNGCDSILTIDLTIVDIEANINVVSDLLTASPAGATYQWINCATFNSISGETNQFYSPGVTGNYAVIISDNECVDTSDCTQYNVGIEELWENETFKIYPNPGNGLYNVSFNDITTFEDIIVQVYNSFGQLILSDQFLISSSNQTEIIDLSFCESGVYLIKFVSEENIRTYRVVQN